MDNQKLTKTELEVLVLLQQEFLTPKQIAIRRKRNISSIYKIIKKLCQKGYYNSTTKKCHNSESTFTPFLNGIRLHGQELNIKLLYKDKRYLMQKDKSNYLEYDGNTIRLYKDSLEIYIGHSFYGETPQQATTKSIHYINRFLTMLENHLYVILKKPKINNINLVNSHYAEINNGIAKDCEAKGDKIRIYSQEDGKLWFLIDNSFNLHEMETVHPKTAKPDMEMLQKYINDIRDNIHNLPSQNKAITETLLFTITELASAQLNTQKQLQCVLQLIYPTRSEEPQDTPTNSPPYYCG